VLLFSGTADPLIPYTGGPIGPFGRAVQRRSPGPTDRGLAVAAETVATDWAAANGIAGGPTVEPVPTAPGDLAVTRLTWRAGARPLVVLHRVVGGGHTWPGGGQYLPARIVGPVVHSLDATGLLLQQFLAREAARP
jgi:polyhydroxybutyrate depolymerase